MYFSAFEGFLEFLVFLEEWIQKFLGQSRKWSLGSGFYVGIYGI